MSSYGAQLLSPTYLLAKPIYDSPLKYWMYSSQHAIDDIKIATLNLLHKLRQKIWPFCWEIFSSNDADGIAQLYKIVQKLYEKWFQACLIMYEPPFF